MGYIGTKPSAVPLTSADITDGIIVNADVNASAAIALTKLASTGTLTVDNIQFPATAVSSANANNLDDYEEGTWTPVPTFGSANAGMVHISSGDYTKIGRMVTVRCTFNITTKGSSTGVWRVAGLPFTSKSSNVSVGGLFGDGFTFTGAQIGTLIISSESTVTLIIEQGGAGVSSWNYLFDTNFHADGEKFFSVTYFV